MKGNTKIIDILNKLLAGELTSMDQYFTHSRMYDDWGFSKLYERIDHEMDDEKEHADRLIKRILLLEGVPAVGNRSPLKIGKDVPEMLKNDLELERSVIVALREAIAVCEQEKDYQTREILEVMLADTEEDHAHWLEQQLGLIEKVGLQNYLQSQM
ncbi:MAG TPA: bacterioferritin [Nitrosomonas nitrosa]|jgi:bacterioferritin|uniref:Bacterioferritin n=1 Tax=Nitrosomonas nitrosa TaxID=52442 RepID=A0A1I4U5B9_9PROT|nr:MULTISPECIES: bacterioferritin [Nitrosomonas]MCO6433286.1 bacterioferritin [Nitrosomonas nitrosa]MCW5602185.1 bacterioferritin [Nitrosomonas sp.]PTQ90555.1 bacterioferritin [Nitrosomonas nitrosa]CAE6517274.1 bacterioferritin, iron storage and detoxification protein [Nitrosomonas nitrosa]SFM84139.1 bacterioferritin [Nitrosomonas nitrosa]